MNIHIYGNKTNIDRTKNFCIQVRECKANDKSKQHCFELYASGGAEIIKACKTDSEGKVRKYLNNFVVFILFINIVVF